MPNETTNNSLSKPKMTNPSTITFENVRGTLLSHCNPPP